MQPRSRRLGMALVAFAAAALQGTGPAIASDHDDTPLLKLMQRGDTRLTDLYAFTHGPNLVLALCVDPTVPTDRTDYTFPTTVTYEFYIDTHSPVRFDDPADLATYGGTVVNPDHIRGDVRLMVTFDDTNHPRLLSAGVPAAVRSQIQLFTGLRDDPFIRGPRQGRNVAAIVLELPLQAVRKGAQSTLLIWATSKMTGVYGPMHDHAGRSLRSQFIENDLLNTRPPAQHQRDLGVPPDVIIYDTARPAAFPNGRALTDDVVDLVGDMRIIATDGDPSPSANDLPFLDTFPYLAAPHPPPTPTPTP